MVSLRSWVIAEPEKQKDLKLFVHSFELDTFVTGAFSGCSGFAYLPELLLSPQGLDSINHSGPDRELEAGTKKG